MIKVFTSILMVSSLCLGVTRAADYFWVGGTGAWSDLSHWASMSSGPGNAYLNLPGNADNVYFDANSFLAPGGVITVDVTATVNNIDFNGVANTPTFAGASALTVHGDFRMVAGMTSTYTGTLTFRGTTSNTITCGTQTVGGNVNFRGTGDWTFQDAFTCTGEMGLRQGTITMNGQNVTCASIDCNRTGDDIREIDFGASVVTLSAGGTALDLRGNSTNLTVSSTTAVINFTSTANITVECGNMAKTIPDLDFVNTDRTVQIYTGSAANTTERITFGNLTAQADGVNFRVDGNNNNSNVKSYGNISLPNNCDFRFGAPNSTGWSSVNRNLFLGTFTIGDNADGDVRGHYTAFQGAVTYGENADCNYRARMQFMDAFTVASTGGNRLIMNHQSRFQGMISATTDDVDIRLERASQINGGVTVAPGVHLTFQNDGNDPEITTSGGNNWVVGTEGILTIGNGNDGEYILSNTVILNSEARLEVNSGGRDVTFNNLTLNAHNTVELSTATNTSISGTFTAVGDCSTWYLMKSNVAGAQATLNLSGAQGVSGMSVADINATGAVLTVTGGTDLNNNSANVNFAAATTGTTLTWMGSNTSATPAAKTGGTFSTGDNNDWSNPVNWSSTGSFDAGNQCIPNQLDNVIFNANSFNDGGAYDIDIDLNTIFFHDMTATGLPAGVTFDGNAASNAREMQVYGSLQLHSNFDNQFEGTTLFTSTAASSETVTMDGSEFSGRIEFSFPGSDWTFTDNVVVDNDQFGDIIVANGTLDLGANNVSLTDDFTVNNNGTLVSGTSTVEFNGRNANGNTQQIRLDGTGDFYNITVNRQTNGGNNNRTVQLATPITVNNDLRIEVGALFDNGNQITGNATGEFRISANARLELGNNNTPTIFPTGYVNANIVIVRRGRVYYNCRCDMTVSGEPDYGELYLSNSPGGGTIATKTLDGPIQVKRRINVSGRNNFADGGFQISAFPGENPNITLNNNAQMTIGTATSSTEFPIDFNNKTLNNNTTVTYNGGLDQDVFGLAGGGSSSYYNLVLTNTTGVNRVKTLTGNTIVRNDLTIGVDNELDAANGSDYSIEIRGDWTNNGSFTPRNGTVTFNGNANQQITSNGTTETYSGLTIDNGAGITLNDDITISAVFTLTDGIVSPAASEIVELTAAASVAGTPSNSAHVNGKVRKIGSANFEFPTGKSGFWMPIEVRNLSAAETFEAEYFPFGHSVTAVKGGDSLRHPSVLEYWTLDRSGTASADVRLHWKDVNRSEITSGTDLLVAHFDGIEWENYGNDGFSYGATGWVESHNVNDFSPFTFGSPTGAQAFNPLPVTLVNFNAVPVEGEVNLTWVTTEEINNDYFTVERSVYGESWSEFAVVNGFGNSNDVIEYQTTDNAPLNGQSYYRLKQTDFNGDVHYSNIVAVNISVVTVGVYPNPVSSGNPVHVNFSTADDVHLVLTDIAGNTLLNEVIDSMDGTYDISTSGLSAGVYFLEVSSNGDRTVKRVVVE